MILLKQHISCKVKPQAIKGFFSVTFTSLLTYVVLKVK